MKRALALFVVLPLLPFILLGELLGWALAQWLPHPSNRSLREGFKNGVITPPPDQF